MISSVPALNCLMSAFATYLTFDVGFFAYFTPTRRVIATTRPKSVMPFGLPFVSIALITVSNECGGLYHNLLPRFFTNL